MSKAKLDLTAMLAAQTQGRFFGPQPPEAYDKPTNIVVAGNGIFRVVKTPVALFKAKISDIPAGSGIPGLAPMEEGPELLIPKIPLKYLIMILTFYKDVYTKDKTEASALFFWNHTGEELPTEYSDKTPIKGLIQDGQFVIYCPEQKNSGTLSQFGDDTMVPYLREHCTPLCETHSHHTMDAFWSGTDDANENMTQFYGVWGKINDAEPKFLFRWVCGDKKINIDPSILFDIPQVEIKTTVTTTVPVEGFEPQVTEKVEYKSYKGPWQRVEAPEDWMGQHSKSWGAGTTYYKGKQGGAATQPPSGGNGYQTYWGDEHYDGYGYGGAHRSYGHGTHGAAGRYQDEDDFTADAQTKTADDVKKNLRSGTNLKEAARTAVEIFLEKEVNADKSIPDVEEMVRHLVEELIDLGYDHVISDTVQENSGYSHYNGGRYY